MTQMAATIWGLDIRDAGVVLVFLAVILGIGLFASRAVKKETDLYLGGRKLGRALQFFLNFGNSTDSTGAVTVSTAVYQNGAGGIWFGFQTLFITPFFWFIQPWWRRARVVTMGDLFVERFNSERLASAYAVFNIFMALFTMGMGNFYAFKVTQAMIVKPMAEYSAADRKQVAEYQEYRGFQSRIAGGELGLRGSERFKYLDDLRKRGELESVVSYVKPMPFYLAYSGVVGIYIVLGGLRAAAITDAVQGLLILVMSVLLIPIGLRRIGGFHGLHTLVPADLFHVTSDLTWYTVVAITFASLVQIIGLLHNMSTAGSARDEKTARFGMISGGFMKRLVLIAWMLCGLIGIAVLRGRVSDADHVWGSLSRELLGPGLFGLMLSGMLLGHMPSVGVYAVSVAGLVTRNLYEPMVRGRSDRHYLCAGRWAIAGVLVVAVIFALCMSDVVSAYTDLVTFNTFFGAAIFLLLFWRRLTGRAILVGLVVWILVMGVVPRVLPMASGFRQMHSLLIESPGGAVFFDEVVRVDPEDPGSALEGIGRFNVENYSLHMVGVPVERFSAGQTLAVRWGFDGLFPFLLLIGFSLVSGPVELERGDRFFAKMRTPVAANPEMDRREVELSEREPRRFDDKKLRRGSDWQFCRWTVGDVWGFCGCWVIVGGILWVLWIVLHFGGTL
jgi:solute:Na+ symporter, SSS family